MESSINFSNAFNITELLAYNDIFSGVPLFATYLKILLLLVTIPATVIPAVLVIYIIRITKELHTKYCLFLVNLLISDILTGCIQFGFEIFIMILYLLNIRIHVSDWAFFITSIPQVATQYTFVLLAIDRVVGVAFPYHYRNIMKPRVVYALIASVWIIAAALLLLTRFFEPPYLVWPFGIFIPPSGVIGGTVLHVFPQVVSAVLIIGTNVYLYCIIIQSKRKLENNLKLSGRGEGKITSLQRLIHNLQMQLESSLPVFILGGVDCLTNILRVIIYYVVYALYHSDPPVRTVLIQFFVISFEYCQIISHSVTYGIHKKEVKKKLHQYYRHLQRLCPLHPSKVVTLHTK